MRALVLWSDNESANLGVRVLAQGAKQLALDAWPDAEISYQGLGRSSNGFRVTTAMMRRDIGRRKGPIKQWLRQYDVILDTGAGDSFTDIYGLGRLSKLVYIQLVAKRLRIPLVLTPQTIGPFNSRRGRLAASRSIRAAALVVTRDHASEEFARSLGRRQIVASSDLVFALRPPESTIRRDVVFNVSGLLWSGDSHVDSAKYKQAVHALLQGLLSEGRKVTLFAHVLANHTTDSDAPVLAELSEQYGNRVDVCIPASLDEARSVLSSANVVVGSRMHACLNALSTGTPAIAWAYSRKFAPLLRDVGWEHTIDLRSDEQVVERTMDLLSLPRSTELASEAALVARNGALKLDSVVQHLKGLAKVAAR